MNSTIYLVPWLSFGAQISLQARGPTSFAFGEEENHRPLLTKVDELALPFPLLRNDFPPATQLELTYEPLGRIFGTSELPLLEGIVVQAQL